MTARDEERSARDLALGDAPRSRPAHLLTSLRLCGCELGHGDGFAVLCAALQRNDTVVALDVSDNWLGDAAARAMAVVLRTNGPRTDTVDTENWSGSAD